LKGNSDQESERTDRDAAAHPCLGGSRRPNRRERGTLTLVAGRLVFITEAGVRFGFKLNNIVNLKIVGDIVELDVRLSGITSGRSGSGR